MDKIENAKSILWYYFELIARKSGTIFDCDSRAEIEGIIDDIVDGIKED